MEIRSPDNIQYVIQLKILRTKTEVSQRNASEAWIPSLSFHAPDPRL